MAPLTQPLTQDNLRKAGVYRARIGVSAIQQLARIAEGHTAAKEITGGTGSKLPSLNEEGLITWHEEKGWSITKEGRAYLAFVKSKGFSL